MEKLGLWYCDVVPNSPLQIFLLVFALAGAYLYGKDKKKLAWILIAIAVVSQFILSAFTHLIFTCALD